MRVIRALVAALLLVIAAPALNHAQTIEPAAGEQKVNIDAEEISYDQKSDSVVARGKVVIERGEMELRADEVHVRRATNEADASGHVKLTGPEGTVTADEVHLNLDDETGFLENAAIQARRNQYSLQGERVEKGFGQSYHIENGRFTTCHCDEGAPSWSISGDDLRVDVGGLARLRGGTLNVLGTPVLYIPRALFPVQRERQSGMLMPRFGVSNRRGFQTLLPVYWAISKTQDVTVALDLETSARAGLVGEYRYRLSRTAGGLLNVSYFNESFRGTTDGTAFEPIIPQQRWSVAAEHEQQLFDNVQAYGDLFRVSDDLFVRDINTYAFEHARDVAIRTLPFTQSRVGVVALWDRVALKGEGVSYQDLTAANDSLTLERAPEINLWGQTPLVEPVLGELNAAAVDFQRSHGTAGVRLDIQPRATVPLPLGRFGYGDVQASLRETAYQLTDRTVAGTGQKLAGTQTRELAQLGAEVGTMLGRVYPVGWLSLEKIKHTLEPRLAYLYVPTVSQDDLPLFDGTDRVGHRNLVTYGLVSRFIGKFSDASSAENGPEAAAAPADANGAVRELGRLSLMQSVDINREIHLPQSDRAADHFSDVDFAGRFNPSRFLSLRFRTNYDTGVNEISAAKVGFFIET